MNAIIFAKQRHYYILRIGHKAMQFCLTQKVASPNITDKGEKTEGHSLALEISRTEELMLYYLKL
jgi:hypothetical protein